MSMSMITECRTDLPDWVRENILTRCPECGCYIMDNSNTGVTTARWCSNPSCPGHLAQKADEMAKFFGIKGVGPETAKSTIVVRKFKSHMDFIPIWFKGEKPKATLADIAVLVNIDGYGATTANNELTQFARFEDYFNSCYVNPLLLPYKDILISAQKYFTLKTPLSGRKIYVMGTGSFHGFSSRKEFFREMNDAFGSIIHIIETGKRKTGISYLIKENDAVDHSKTDVALECGIPIVTPLQFISIMQSMCSYYNEN